MEKGIKKGSLIEKIESLNLGIKDGGKKENEGFKGEDERSKRKKEGRSINNINNILSL